MLEHAVFLSLTDSKILEANLKITLQYNRKEQETSKAG